MSNSTPDTQTENTEPERENPGEGNPTTASSSEGDTAPTQQQGDGGSAATGEVTDDMLHEDLQPSDDNPLAKPLDDEDEDAGLSLGADGPQG
jgi:hypothetical protein